MPLTEAQRRALESGKMDTAVTFASRNDKPKSKSTAKPIPLKKETPKSNKSPQSKKTPVVTKTTADKKIVPPKAKPATPKVSFKDAIKAIKAERGRKAAEEAKKTEQQRLADAAIAAPKRRLDLERAALLEKQRVLSQEELNSQPMDTPITYSTNPQNSIDNTITNDQEIPVQASDFAEIPKPFEATASGNPITPPITKPSVKEALNNLGRPELIKNLENILTQLYPEDAQKGRVGEFIANMFGGAAKASPLNRALGFDLGSKVQGLSEWLSSGLNGDNSGNLFNEQRTKTLTPEQEELQNTAIRLALSELMGPQYQPDISGIEERALKDFQTKTVPSLAERFTSMGGGQRSSAFTGALGSAASDLQSQLAALRSQHTLQQQQMGQNRLSQLLNVGFQPAFNTGIAEKGPSNTQSILGLVSRLAPKLGALWLGGVPGSLAEMANSAASAATASPVNNPAIQKRNNITG